MNTTIRAKKGPLALKALAALGAAAAIAAWVATSASGAFVLPVDPPMPLGSLKMVPVPEPSNLNEFVQDRAAAIRLGKALFWDVQVGGDGKTACATCHNQAGADGRAKNTLNPGQAGGDQTFQLGGPNYTLTAGDFPFTKHVDPDDPLSPILNDKNDVAGSQGVTRAQFVSAVPGNPADTCNNPTDTLFNVNGHNTRQTTGRNAPTVINAVFNFRNFHDGRANNDFNGVNPFGQRDPNARIYKRVDGDLQPVQVVIPLASLASQVVGPPNNEVEMACAGRVFPQLGKKLLDPGIVALGQQAVHPQDSVLGPVANSQTDPPAKGISETYVDLIQKAFRSEYWQSDSTIPLGNAQYTQMEMNFSLFMGLSVQLYESTLVSDGTPFDQFMEGNANALTARQKQGLAVFQGQGRCLLCHAGPELTNASVRNVTNERLERMIVGNGGCAVYDNGFYNIGVRPTAEDIGIGGTDPFGNPLSETGMAQRGLFTDPTLAPALGTIPECDTRANVNGAFKTPALRNVELTGPYFHNGGKATLRQVVEFYDRGSDFGQANIADLDADVVPLGLTDAQRDALVDFLVALTDERVRWNRAPFDHPELCVPNGHVGNHTAVTPDPMVSARAADEMVCLPANGATGADAPLATFMGLSPFQGEDDVPTVSIQSPSAGSVLSGVITVQAVVQDDLGVAKVEYAINGGSYVLMSLDSGSGLYQGAVDTSIVADGGTLSYSIRATDSSGRVVVRQSSFIVNNGGPLLTLVNPSPTNPVLVSGLTHTLRVQARDAGTGTVSVEWQIDSDAPFTPEAAAWQPMAFNAASGRWEASWTAPTLLEEKTIALFIRATDGAGKSRESITSVEVPPAGWRVDFTGHNGERLTGWVTIEPIGPGGANRLGIDLDGSGLRPHDPYGLRIKAPGVQTLEVVFQADEHGNGSITAEVDTDIADESGLTVLARGHGF